MKTAETHRYETVDMFGENHIHRMTHKMARATEVAAAAAACVKRNALHNAILDAFRAHGPMTDEQLERLPQFERYAPSTIRCRRVDLSNPRRAGSNPPIIPDGITERPGRTPMTRWKLHNSAPEGQS